MKCLSMMSANSVEEDKTKVIFICQLSKVNLSAYPSIYSVCDYTSGHMMNSKPLVH